MINIQWMDERKGEREGKLWEVVEDFGTYFSDCRALFESFGLRGSMLTALLLEHQLGAVL